MEPAGTMIRSHKPVRAQFILGSVLEIYGKLGPQHSLHNKDSLPSTNRHIIEILSVASFICRCIKVMSVLCCNSCTSQCSS